MLSFTYNGVTSQELGIMVNKLSHHDILANERNEKGSFQRLNGSVYLKSNSFEAYTLDVECTLFNNFKVETISKIKSVFKNRDGELIISNKPGYILKVRLISTVNFEKLFFNTGTFLLTFEVYPFSYLQSGREWVTLSNGTLKNQGNCKCYPLFKITSSSACTLSVNGQVMEFTGVNKQFIVDTELEDVYGTEGENLNNFMSIDSDFIGFEEGDNIISSSGITKLEVLPRWCEL